MDLELWNITVEKNYQQQIFPEISHHTDIHAKAQGCALVYPGSDNQVDIEASLEEKN